MRSIAWTLFLLAATPHASAAPPINDAAPCLPGIARELGAEHTETHHKIESLEELLLAFTQGLSPDLSDPTQRDAFEVYRRLRFGDANTDLNPGTLDEVAKIINAHPELEKEPFRSFKLEVRQRTYPVTKELAAYLDSQLANAGQTKANLFQIEANSGYWKTLFQYKAPEAPTLEPLTRESSPEQKAAYRIRSIQIKEERKTLWNTFLNSKITPQVRAALLDSAMSPSERAKVLYEFFKKERHSLLTEGKDIQPISQAMIDLVHTIGYQDPSILQDLKSSDGKIRLQAYRAILTARDSFAMTLGYEGHFEQVLAEIGGPAGVLEPSGIPSIKGIAKNKKNKVTGETEKTNATEEALENLEEGIGLGTETENASSSTRTVRQLSLVESPFRSCLGGSDCSSRTYLTRALDPNYQYFTLTDESGASSGHITVVLGDGTINGKPVKIAFIDKVQNVRSTDLPSMVEAVRRSVGENGYLLSRPDYMGDHNGISNEFATSSFIQNGIKTDSQQPVTKFSPHKHSYVSPNKYSRADSGLAMHVVAPLELPKGVELTGGESTRPWKTGALDLSHIVEASMRLKESASLDDRLRYIPAMEAIQKARLGSDPEFESTLARWLADPSTPFQLRKQVALYDWTKNPKPFSQCLAPFNGSEKIQFLQNLLDTPKYKDLILKSKKDLPDLMVIARGSKTIRKALLSAYLDDQSGFSQTMIERVLGAKDIPDAAVANLAVQIRDKIHSTDAKDMLSLRALVQGTSLEKGLRDELPIIFVSNHRIDVILAQNLLNCLNSPDRAVRDFGTEFLTRADDPKLAHLNILKEYQQIREFQTSRPELGGFSEAAKAWLSSEKTPQESKISFLSTVYGARDASGASVYESYLAAIPHDQLGYIKSKVNQITGRAAYTAFSKDQPELQALLDAGKPESFAFRTIQPPPGGGTMIGSPPNEPGRWQGEDRRWVSIPKAFNLQATPVTQLQWTTVMDSNPSHFSKDGQTVATKGRNIFLNPNRPVERVTFDDVKRFIQKLNEMDPYFNYRLPTATEWEYAARAGTETAFPFGQTSAELADHAYFSGNSGKQTHDVASLKPNANGLYDMSGNVSELTPDIVPGFGPRSPTDTAYSVVIVGGSYSDAPNAMRPASRSSAPTTTPNPSVGFRLVREPK